MATPVEKIFLKFLNQIDDVELSMIEDEELEELLIEYLENSIIEFNECTKNLELLPTEKIDYTICVNPSDMFDEIESDENVDVGFIKKPHWQLSIPKREFMEFEMFKVEHIIDPDFGVTHPPSTDDEDNESSRSVSIKYTPLKENIDYMLEYIVEDEELNIYFTMDIEENTVFELQYTSSAYISEDLTLEEIYILAYGMVLSWLNPKIRREENLRQMMNDRDYKQLSSASMLGKLIDLSSHTRKELNRYKQRYSYKEFKGFD